LDSFDTESAHHKDSKAQKNWGRTLLPRALSVISKPELKFSKGVTTKSLL
jgi:hypothetical protein